jgi:type I restriction enzyme S subunit
LVGKTAIVTKEYENYAYAGYLIRLRFDLNQILPEYVRYWFSTAVIRKIIEGQASSTSGVNNINTKKIESLPFKLIPLKEQIRVVAKVDQLLALCDELEKKLTAKSYLADSISF